jgi:hypothetical protein
VPPEKRRADAALAFSDLKAAIRCGPHKSRCGCFSSSMSRYGQSQDAVSKLLLKQLAGPGDTSDASSGARVFVGAYAVTAIAAGPDAAKRPLLLRRMNVAERQQQGQIVGDFQAPAEQKWQPRKRRGQ